MNCYNEKYFSVLGDSLSTLSGYQLPDYPAFYRETDGGANGVTAPGDIWWGQLIAALGGKLLVNNSFAGSLVCRHPDCVTSSFACSDARTAGLSAGGVSPDVILVLMGLNDCGYGMKPHPETDEERFDLSVFSVAYRTMLKKIRKNYPAAEIFCLTLPLNEGASEARAARLAGYNAEIEACAAACGCPVVPLGHLTGYETDDGLHPTARGMKTISAAVLENMQNRR